MARSRVLDVPLRLLWLVMMRIEHVKFLEVGPIAMVLRIFNNVGDEVGDPLT
jgi:hypothetical protein